MKYDIVPLKPGDAKLVGRVIEDGFAHDPICNWVFNNNNAALYPFFSMLCGDHYLREGFGNTTAKEEGVALWVAPYKNKDTGGWSNFKSMLMMARYGGMTGLKRGGALTKSIPKKTPEPFYYLFLLSTTQAERGKGLGGRLIEPGLARIDDESADSYLESSNEKNLSFYRRYGYEIIKEIQPMPDSPRMWIMLRPGKKA